MTLDDFRQLCEQRRSVRYFTDQAVTKETLMQLMAIANLAPSVENTQPWHFHIILKPELSTKLMETSCYGNFVGGAGAFLVVTCDRLAKPTSQQILWNPKEIEYSCVTAMEHILLAATAMGLGSCWVSLHHGHAHDLLKLRDNQVIIGGIMLGHLKPGEEKSGSGHLRKPVESIYTLYE